MSVELEAEVWDGDEYYASVAGPKAYVMREVDHYAKLLLAQGAEDIQVNVVDRRPMSLRQFEEQYNEG